MSTKMCDGDCPFSRGRKVPPSTTFEDAENQYPIIIIKKEKKKNQDRSISTKFTGICPEDYCENIWNVRIVINGKHEELIDGKTRERRIQKVCEHGEA